MCGTMYGSREGVSYHVRDQSLKAPRIAIIREYGVQPCPTCEAASQGETQTKQCDHISGTQELKDNGSTSCELGGLLSEKQGWKTT